MTEESVRRDLQRQEVRSATRRDRAMGIARSPWFIAAVVVIVVLVLSSALHIPWLGDLSDWLIERAPQRADLFVQYAVPIGFGALCGLMCERSGVVNIGIEGMMLTAAFVAFLSGASSGRHGRPSPAWPSPSSPRCSSRRSTPGFRSPSRRIRSSAAR
jgi:ABC-type uncharacterized transport system permease subunit